MSAEKEAQPPPPRRQPGASSIAFYRRTYDMLSQAAGSSDAKRVFAYIAKNPEAAKKSTSTKMTYLSALLYCGKPSEAEKDDIKALVDKLGRLKRQEESEKGALARPSAKGVFDKGVTWKNVVDFVDEKLKPAAKEAAEAILEARKSSLAAVKAAATDDRVRALVKYFVLRMHVARPLRNDYRSLRIVHAKKTKSGNGELSFDEPEPVTPRGGAEGASSAAIQDSERAEKNVIIFSRSGKAGTVVTPVKILIRVFKTARTVPQSGDIDLEKDGLMSDEVFVDTTRALYAISKANHSDFLFPPMSSGLYHHLLTSTLRPLARDIGSSVLRKLFDSWKYGDIEAQRAADASRMGHSVETASKFYTTTLSQKPPSEDVVSDKRSSKRKKRYE